MNLNKKQKIIVGIVSLAIIGGGSFTYSSYKFQKEYKQQQESLIDMYQVGGKEKIFMSGKVLPQKSESIFVSSEQGELATIKVSDEQYVNKGDILFTCKNSSQIKEISDLNLQIDIKKKEKQNALDEESKKAIDLEIKQLNAQVSILNKTAYQSVYAPFSGVVYLNKKSSEGEPVLILETTDMYVLAQVNERDSYRISKDQDVELTSIATKEKYNGTISKISNRPVGGSSEEDQMGVGQGMTNYEVDIALNSQDNLKSGLNMQIVAFFGSDYKKVPTSAIFEEGGKSYVYKVVDGIAKKTEVTKVSVEKEFTLIKSGVKENDSIIKNLDITNIKDGQKIEATL